MTIKNDKWIRESGILSPCFEFTNKDEKGNGIISKGISSYGYDLTCSNEFSFVQLQFCYSTIIDPKEVKGNFVESRNSVYTIPANSFVLCRSVEYIKMPRNIIGICMGKSTYARCGVIVNTTLLEPEWEGNLVIELSNSAPFPVKIYANEGIAQLVFMESNDLCEISYKDRKGKYQGQTGITTAKV